MRQCAAEAHPATAASHPRHPATATEARAASAATDAGATATPAAADAGAAAPTTTASSATEPLLRGSDVCGHEHDQRPELLRCVRCRDMTKLPEPPRVGHVT